jgi:acetolactate synthase-1/2/3 large subunit
MNAGQIIGQTLKLYGVDHFFAFTGGDQDIWLGLRDAGIKYVLPHSERSAVAMADAYARLTGKPSFTYGQSGPGAAVCVSGLVDAYWAKSPVICITSDTHSAVQYRHAYQGIDDQQSLFSNITKWNVRVPNLGRLPDILRSAIRIAVSGVPGPVHIDIPSELTIFTKEDLADAGLYAEPECVKFPAYRRPPVTQEIERAMDVIAEAKRPLILAGGGVLMSEAWEDLRQFAERLSIPVVASAAGKSALATTHPLAVGVTGNYSRKVANDVVEKCDTYIVIGSNLGDMTTKRWRLPSPSAKIIHIDLDPNVMGANLKEEISIPADAKLALQALIKAAEASPVAKRTCPWTGWVREVQSLVAAWNKAFQSLAKKGGRQGALNPYFVLNALNQVIAPEDVVVADTGYMGAYAAALVEVKTPGRKYVRTAGSLGWGFPASLGAQVAIGNKGRVICITGDGGIGYHAADIETAVRMKLPVVVLVLNNSTLAFEYHLQKYMYKTEMPEVNDFMNIDYGAVAKAFGAQGEKVTKARDVEGALKRALDCGRTAVIDFAIGREFYAPVVYYEPFVERKV